LTSNYPLNVYVYDNATLDCKNSELSLNTLGARGSARVVLEGCAVSGNLNIECAHITIKRSTITSERLYVSATTYNYAESTFNQPLEFSGNSVAELTSVYAPAIDVRDNATVKVMWKLRVKTIDVEERVVSGARVVIYRYENLTADFYDEGLTDTLEKGEVVFNVISRLLTPKKDVFIGNYKIVAYYTTNETENATVESNTVIKAVHTDTDVVLKFDEILAWPFYVTVDCILRPDTVMRGEHLVVSGFASLDRGPPAKYCNVTVKLLETGEYWQTTTDENGEFHVAIVAPYQRGKYTVNVYATTDHIYGERNLTLTVNGVEKPRDVYAYFTQGYLPWSVLGMALTWLVIYIGMRRRIVKEIRAAE
jgi:hypothetical protein